VIEEEIKEEDLESPAPKISPKSRGTKKEKDNVRVLRLARN
jgi:hypothetical protein